MDEQEYKDWSYDCKAASGQFLDGPGWIKKFTLTADGTNTTLVSFYDGHTTGGRHIITLRTVANRSHSIDYEIPFKVEQGLYADIAANVECVTVQYKKDKP